MTVPRIEIAGAYLAGESVPKVYIAGAYLADGPGDRRVHIAGAYLVNGPGDARVHIAGVYTIHPPVPSLPCALEWTLYGEDGATIRAQATTDPTWLGESWAAKPYLMEPTSYGEQEVDFTEGRASIGQVNVAVIDPRQLPDDQDSGWMTERLIDVAGRRNRLRRWVSDAGGWVTIADGPGSFPRLRSTFAGYEWSIRDTREKERRLRAFLTTDTIGAFPRGVIDGWGQYDEYDYAAPPIEPALGQWQNSPGIGEPHGVLTKDAAGDIFWDEGDEIPENIVYVDAIADLFTGVYDPDIYAPYGGWRYPLVFHWRLAGSSDPWVVMPGVTVSDAYFPDSGPLHIGWVRPKVPILINPGVLADETEVQGVYSIRMDWVDPVTLALEPDAGDDIEFFFSNAAPVPVSENFPFHLDGLTVGEFLANLYDGLYSPRDSLGNVIPTGIRYDEAALLAMDTPIRLRITEPVDDVREWAEENIYKPMGYAPAFDSEGRISPVSQLIPAASSITDVIDNDNAAPVPAHTPGDNVINILNFKYQRAYPNPTSEAVDGLSVRDIEIEYRNESSIERFGPQEWEVETVAFVAVGDAGGAAVETEVGATEAEARDTHLADRRAFGTDLVVVPVMRQYTGHLRVGGWVRVLLTWVPNNLTGRRSLDHMGQILAIKDLNCAWREMTIELVAGWDSGEGYS